MTQVSYFFFFLNNCVDIHKDEGIKFLKKIILNYSEKTYNIYFLIQIYVDIYVRAN